MYWIQHIHFEYRSAYRGGMARVQGVVQRDRKERVGNGDGHIHCASREVHGREKDSGSVSARRDG
jgi:hypothetical protein